MVRRGVIGVDRPENLHKDIMALFDPVLTLQGGDVKKNTLLCKRQNLHVNINFSGKVTSLLSFFSTLSIVAIVVNLT